VLSSAMNLCACALGASMLSLPYAMAVGGPVATAGLLVVFAGVSFYAGQAVVDAGVRAKTSSYSAIVADAFGPVAGLAAETLLSVALLVAAISYIVGLADLLPEIIGVAALVGRTARSTFLLFPRIREEPGDCCECGCMARGGWAEKQYVPLCMCATL
jgi:amino acid permease